MKAFRTIIDKRNWLMLCVRICFKRVLRPFVAGIGLLASSHVYAISIADVATGGVTTAAMEAVLTGSGVTVTGLVITNVAGCNDTQAVGIFTNGTTAAGGAGPVLSEPTGVVVANAQITNAGNPIASANNVPNVSNTICGGAVSDADMVAIEPGTAAGEYASIVFNVIPQFSTLAIPFQFGSDEFPEYVCSNFNDLVGIFVSGPGIAGPFSFGAENYAKTIGGNLSSINWVNTGVIGTAGGTNIANCTAPNGSFANTAFYTDNSNGNLNGGSGAVAVTNANLEMDGFTNTLFQPIAVTAGATYRVKIVVSDSADRVWDSAAFIHPIFSTGTFIGFDYGDAPDSYRTLTSNGGPSHGIDATIFMGAGIPDA